MQLQIQTTEKKQVLDITDRVQEQVDTSNIEHGICIVFVAHTTACVTTADLDPGTDLDMLDAFEALMPKLNYRHPHNPEHVTDHILSSIIDPSVSVPFSEKKLQLGTWQRIVLIELDGPRERTLQISLVETIV